MKRFLESLKGGLGFGLGILITLFVGSVIASLNSVEPGDTLTANKWNELIGSINSLNSEVENIKNENANFNEYAVGVEYDTRIIHPNGKKIYRKTYSLDFIKNIEISGHFTSFIDDFDDKVFMNFDPAFSYVVYRNSSGILTMNSIPFYKDDWYKLIFQGYYQQDIGGNLHIDTDGRITIVEGYITILYYYK